MADYVKGAGMKKADWISPIGFAVSILIILF